VRAFVRRIVPLALRRHLAGARRRVQDRGLAFAHERAAPGSLNALIPLASLTQRIFEAPRVGEKRVNLAKAAGLFEGLQIGPGQVFSFWAIIGEPSAAKGWQAGRTIINDVVSADPGGGLCQMSGLIHHLGVLAGLDVVERHPHSADLYQEDQRFMPLGLDATVVFGFKDLRLRNGGAAPVWLSVAMTVDTLSGAVLCARPGAACTLEQVREEQVGARAVRTTRVWPDGRRELLSIDQYRL
jgi:vancomycin resistance protein VanW